MAAVLSDLRDKRGLPPRITVDNGTKFTSRALDHWAYWNKVEFDFARPGKPVDNTFVEAFHRTFRRESTHSTGSQVSRTHAGRFGTGERTTTIRGHTAA